MKRSLLLLAVVSTAVGFAASVGGCGDGVEPTGTAVSAQRSYVNGYFAIELDGHAPGLITRMRGGDVQEESVRCSNRLCLDAPASPAVSAWLGTYLAGRSEARSGSIVRYDREGLPVERVAFSSAQIVQAEILPEAAGAHGPAGLRLQLAPAAVTDLSTRVPALTAAERAEALVRHRSGFTLPGFPAGCDTPEVRGAFAVAAVGPRQGDPTATIPLRFSAHCRRALEATSTGRTTIDGSFEFLNAGRSKVLLAINFSHLGIFNITSTPRENNDDKIDADAISYSGIWWSPGTVRP